jgi:hypothetical protein
MGFETSTDLAATGVPDVLWEDTRNSLGIARLLAHEGRPEGLLATACRMAVENACRAALEQAGERYEGDARRALQRLAAPEGLWVEVMDREGTDRLAAAERAVAWVARHLRNEAPGRRWGY